MFTAQQFIDNNSDLIATQEKNLTHLIKQHLEANGFYDGEFAAPEGNPLGATIVAILNVKRTLDDLGWSLIYKRIKEKPSTFSITVFPSTSLFY
ncbi:hypothetical protein P0F23_003445 [Vibrio metschnikovii]|nr:hypothetical protein [Vibrio metschnikovii]